MCTCACSVLCRLTMGMDFNYQAAHAWFLNLDKLVRLLPEAEPGLAVFYSTPACYLAALHGAGLAWPAKQDDFLPYASDPHAYWTGFYSSRPTSKRLVRETETMLRTLHQLGLLARAEAAPLQLLEETVGVVQHHDAVTGNTPLQ